MQHVPTRFHLVPSSAARIVVAEPVDDEVPDGAKAVNQQRLAQRNPNVIDRQVAAKEAGDSQVWGLFDGLRMFCEPFVNPILS